MTQGFEPRNTTWDTDDVINNAWAVWVKNILAGGSAASGTEVYFSPVDLTVAFTSATTLTITWLTTPVEPVTEQFIKVVEFKVGGVAVTYSPDQYQFAYDPATNVLTVTGATFVNTSTFRVEVLAQAKSINVIGNATTDLVTQIGGDNGGVTRVVRVGPSGSIITSGEDGGGVGRIMDVDANRRLSTRDDLATGTADAAIATTGYQIGGRAYAGNPAPVSANDDFVRAIYTLLGQMRVYVDSALNRMNDELKSEDIPPLEIVAGGTTTTPATAEHTLQLTATSAQLKLGVFIMIDPLRAAPADGAVEVFGIHYTSADHSIINGGACIAGQFGRATSLVQGNWRTMVFVKIDDLSKCYVTGSIASIPLVYQGI